MNKELNVVTDWMGITITFRTRCYECGKEILPGRVQKVSQAPQVHLFESHLSTRKKITKRTLGDTQIWYPYAGISDSKITIIFS